MLFFFTAIKLIIVLQVQAQIINGGFQNPVLNYFYTDAPSYPYFLTLGWLGKYQHVNNSICPNMTGQFIDTVVSTWDPVNGLLNHLGYISQQIELTSSGVYNLSFIYQIDPPINPSALVLDVIWNQVVVATIHPAASSTLYSFNINVTANLGQNQLTLNNTSLDPSSTYGFFIDDVSLQLITLDYTFSTNSTTLVNSTNPVCIKNQVDVIKTLLNPEQLGGYFKIRLIYLLSVISSLPKGISIISQLVFLADDIWLYIYDDLPYTGLIQKVFQTDKQIENLKWCLINLMAAFKNPPEIPTSNYINFTTHRFVQVQGKDSIFFHNINWFLIITIPQTIIILLVCNLIFRFTKDYYLSKYIRRFCFYGCIFQILFEGNIGYMTFLFFSQSKMIFFFAYDDIFVIGSSILFFGFVFIVMLAFFIITNFMYGKNTVYFIYYFYRTLDSLFYLTFSIVFRSIIQGIAHSLLHYNYPALIFLLVSVEVISVIWTIFTEIKYKIFLKRTQWAFKIVYHFSFILLNLSLLCYYYWMDQEQAKQISLDAQNVFIIVIMFSTSIIVLLDFFPQKAPKNKTNRKNIRHKNLFYQNKIKKQISKKVIYCKYKPHTNDN